MRRRFLRLVVLAGAAWLVAGSGCSRKVPDQTTPRSNVGVGECGDPERDGVVSDDPDITRADRDLDGSGVDEIVAADRVLCSADGNCHWNVFAGADSDCPRYAGTLEAAAIELLDSRGEDGYHDVRAWWKLAGEGRMLMQEYSFRHGSYRVVEALPCVSEPGGRVMCGEQATAGEAAYE